MALDLYSSVHLVIRWIHVIAGITWIGHLYFFNFVNIQFQASIDDATKKAANAQLVLRALWWFRWGAMITFLAGLVLFTMNYMYTPGVGFGPTALFSTPDGITGRATWIMLGALFGIIMWFNVWFVIWPTQKGIFGGKFAGDALAAARKRAGLFSRINTHLSAPMLFGMLAAPHYGAFNIVTFIIILVISEAAVMGAYKMSFWAGKPA
jgi:uncharacterized membrane protein